MSLFVGFYVSTKIIRMHNQDKSLFDEQYIRGAFDLKQEACLRWTRNRFRVNWEMFVRCQFGPNET